MDRTCTCDGIEVTQKCPVCPTAADRDSKQGAIENALRTCSPEKRAEAIKALEIPDMYPARNVAEFLGVKVPDVHSWRRARGFKKARS